MMRCLILAFLTLLLPTSVLLAQNIVAAEYFVDTDMGIGNNTQVSVGSPASEVTLDFNLPVGSLSNGLHTFYLRVKDSDSKWSLASSTLIYKLPDVLAATVEMAEYYFDIDPGLGSATSISIAEGLEEISLLFDPDLSSLGEGLHTLNIRTKDSKGRWSLTATSLVHVVQDISNDEIVRLNYYFTGSDDFVSSMYFEEVNPSGALIDYTFLTDASELTVGETYILHVRPVGSLSGIGNEVINSFTFEREIIWTGATSRNWEVGNNWVGGVVPIVSENVRVPDVTSTSANDPLVTQNHEIKNIQIDQNASVTLDPAGNLSILGSASGEGLFVSERNMAGDLAYSVTGSTVGERDITEAVSVPDIVYGYENGVYVPSATMQVGSGYFIAFNQVSPQLSLSGMPNTGSVDYGISYTDNGLNDDFELVSNPYNSTIHHSDLVAINGMDGTGAIDGAIYLWHDGGGNLPNGTRDGFFEVVNADGVSTGSFDGILEKGQGFFVRAVDEAVTDLTFNSTLQNISGVPSSPPGSRIVELINLKVSLTSESSSDTLVLSYFENATHELETGSDALKFMNPAISFYSLLDNKELAIQTLPSSEKNTTKLGFNVEATGTYKLSINGIENDIDVELIDHVTGITYNLFNGMEIEIALNNLNSHDRFTIIYGNAPLGMEFEKVSLKVSGGRSRLDVQYPTNQSQEVMIYTLDGQRVFQEQIEFELEKATIQIELEEHTIYVLSINDQNVKFLLKN